jgi:hypothetical protein
MKIFTFTPLIKEKIITLKLINKTRNKNNKLQTLKINSKSAIKLLLLINLILITNILKFIKKKRKIINNNNIKYILIINIITIKILT